MLLIVHINRHISEEKKTQLVMREVIVLQLLLYKSVLNEGNHVVINDDISSVHLPPE